MMFVHSVWPPAQGESTHYIQWVNAQFAEYTCCFDGLLMSPLICYGSHKNDLVKDILNEYPLHTIAEVSKFLYCSHLKTILILDLLR